MTDARRAETAPITGGCNCGAVRFRVTGPFLRAVYCHCTRCQRRTGTAASVSALVQAGALEVLQGEDRIRAWCPPGGAEKHFCGDCGSHLYSRTPTHFGVRLGALDSDPQIRPSARQYTAYAAVWEPIPDDGLPRHPEAAPRG